MKKVNISLSFLFLCCFSLFSEWNQWRGTSDGNGQISNQKTVDEWSDSKNVLWKSVVPGKGHSSPVLYGEKVYLTTSDDSKGSLSLLCYNKKDGKLLWQKEALKGKFMKVKHPQSDHAAATPLVNKGGIICSFGIDDASWLVAFSHDGKLKYKKRLSDFVSVFGLGSSPLLYKDKVYILQDNKPQSFLACFDSESGDELWRIKRKVSTEISYSTPRVYNIKGKDLIIVNSLYLLSAYDPKDGKEVWSIKGEIRTTVGSPVLVDDILFCSGGYPEKITVAYKLNPKPTLLWKSKFNSYISSVVAADNEIYVGNSKGIFACLDQKDGSILWKKNLKGKDIIASPYHSDGKLYVATLNGSTKVLKPNRTECEVLKSNQLEGKIFSTAAIVDNKIYQRTHGFLYCIGKK
jgi:outer membrane protein assembly factor BamB